MRHQADEIAWHTRALSRQLAQKDAARSRSGRQVSPGRSRGSHHRRSWTAASSRRACRPLGAVCRWWCTPPIRPICSPASAGTSTSPTSAFWMRGCTPRATATRWTLSRSWRPTCADHYRELTGMVENRLAQTDRRPRPTASTHHGPAVAPGQELPRHAPGGSDARTKRPSAGCCRSRPVTATACCTAFARVGPVRTQCGAGQGDHPGRACGRHLADQRSPVAGQQTADRDRNRIAADTQRLRLKRTLAGSRHRPACPCFNRRTSVLALESGEVF